MIYYRWLPQTYFQLGNQSDGVNKMHALNKNISTPRTKKFRADMILHGFKPMQKWLLDLDNTTI